jgi:hypothetical protein
LLQKFIKDIFGCLYVFSGRISSPYEPFDFQSFLKIFQPFGTEYSNICHVRNRDAPLQKVYFLKLSARREPSSTPRIIIIITHHHHTPPPLLLPPLLLPPLLLPPLLPPPPLPLHSRLSILILPAAAAAGRHAIAPSQPLLLTTFLHELSPNPPPPPPATHLFHPWLSPPCNITSL